MGLEKLEQELEALRVEYEKFQRGNNSAGTRARKICQNIKKAAQELRNDIQVKRKGEGEGEAPTGGQEQAPSA